MNAPLAPAHSPFGGSVVTRVLRCPASVGLVEKVPVHLRRSSAYAERGTALHSALALLLDDNGPSLESLVGRTIGDYAITDGDVRAESRRPQGGARLPDGETQRRPLARGNAAAPNLADDATSLHAARPRSSGRRQSRRRQARLLLADLRAGLDGHGRGGVAAEGRAHRRRSRLRPPERTPRFAPCWRLASSERKRTRSAARTERDRAVVFRGTPNEGDTNA